MAWWLRLRKARDNIVRQLRRMSGFLCSYLRRKANSNSSRSSVLWSAFLSMGLQVSAHVGAYILGQTKLEVLVSQQRSGNPQTHLNWQQVVGKLPNLQCIILRLNQGNKLDHVKAFVYQLKEFHLSSYTTKHSTNLSISMSINININLRGRTRSSMSCFVASLV